ncbi:TIGR02587 family membrane protein [Pontibacter sp. HSC-36F09]|uniref:TIGR02587 family membrane protein n=1 Tax=Pontibacter sp. HSC-36F09 TaxID=2910966 RepID=UPI0020A0FDFB|nr:TIGR02587 family membrane protein [Pontibacter sp. HSC-36F09]MCP2045474.1 putative integral membrane protein (TIGR02587 family) [Pontibacter sp. HSC-36F09]
MADKKNTRPVRKSLQEYARGIAGGLLFSFPLLYTMEVWWAGFTASPGQLLIMVLVTYLLLLGYNRYAGMRPGVSWRSVFIDSVEEMGLGIVLAFGVLFVLNRIQLGEMSIDEIMGKIIVEAMAVSIGVSIGTAQLGGTEDEPEEEDEVHVEAKEAGWRTGLRSKVSLVVLALCGSIVVGGNVAPTEEVLVLATGARPVHILLMAVLSLAMSMVVVYFSDFKGTGEHQQGNLAFAITMDTCLSYLTAVAASAFLLWFFGRFQGVSFETAFAQCIVLGVLSSLGASAGRLLIK